VLLLRWGDRSTPNSALDANACRVKPAAHKCTQAVPPDVTCQTAVRMCLRTRATLGEHSLLPRRSSRKEFALRPDRQVPRGEDADSIRRSNSVQTAKKPYSMSPVAQLTRIARDEIAGDTVPAPLFDLNWEPHVARRRAPATWKQYMAIASQVVGRFHGQFRMGHFDYVHPVRLQPETVRRLKRPYKVNVAYSDWGPSDAPIVVCVGGVASVAMRFNYLASDLCDAFRLICPDWVGRGRSGWLADQGDYSIETYAEQLRQMIQHLGDRPVTVLGSSMGGSAAIELISRHPKLIDRLILNDIGPHIPVSRRRRRAQTLARHYVFREPADMLRRVGASQKNDGPASDDIRFNLTFHQTRWSDEDGGRIYRHDVRALQAYRASARQSLQQWVQWKKVRVPMLLIHGMQSDALFPATIERMSQGKDITLMHIPETGHAPLLADRHQIAFVREWLNGAHEPGLQWSVLHAPPRERLTSQPIRFAPQSALV
jgi:pimeloyl-ACP methyl ester carboxylesterase